MSIFPKMFLQDCSGLRSSMLCRSSICCVRPLCVLVHKTSCIQRLGANVWFLLSHVEACALASLMQSSCSYLIPHDVACQRVLVCHVCEDAVIQVQWRFTWTCTCASIMKMYVCIFVKQAACMHLPHKRMPVFVHSCIPHVYGTRLHPGLCLHVYLLALDANHECGVHIYKHRICVFVFSVLALLSDSGVPRRAGASSSCISWAQCKQTGARSACWCTSGVRTRHLGLRLL